MSANFEVTKEEMAVLGKAYSTVEKVANDLTNLFKKEVIAILSESPLEFMEYALAGKPVLDDKSKQIAEAADAAWNLFRKMDDLCSSACVKPVEKPVDDVYDFEYTVITDAQKKVCTFRGTQNEWNEFADKYNAVIYSRRTINS